MMQPYQQRVVDEKADLDDKLSKLRQFMTSNAWTAVPEPDRLLLIRQEEVMRQYAEILGKRIQRFVDTNQ